MFPGRLVRLENPFRPAGGMDTIRRVSEVSNGKSEGGGVRFQLPMAFGAYELIEEIGRGGAGVVFKARQPVLNRLCAVKMLLGGRFAGPDAEAKLRVEAAAAASLDHPNIVGVYEAGMADGHMFFSMEYVPGQTAVQLARGEMLSAQRVATYVRTMARAIHYAHGRGVLHRDLKPTNVIIDQHDQPQITDFGLTKGVHEPDQTDQGAGSPNFMAPEQASARFGDTGVHTDVFGLGSILYFLLTDRPPFRGETIAATIDAVVRTDPVRPRQFRSGVPEDLETICLKCLEKQPAKRYRTALEVAEELERFLNDEPIHARPVGRMERGWRWCRRHPAIAGFATATTLLLLMLSIGGPTVAYRIREQRDFTRRNLYAADMALAFQALQSGGDRQVLELLDRYRPEHTGGVDLRGWEWFHLAHRSREQSLAVVFTNEATPTVLQLLPDAGRFLVSDLGGRLSLVDVAARRPVWSRIVRTNGNSIFAIAPDAATVMISDRAAGSTNTLLRLHEIADGRFIREFRAEGLVSPFHIDAAGVTWVVGADFVKRLDVRDGRELSVVRFRTNIADYSIAISRDGRHLAAGLADNSLEIRPVAPNVAAGRVARNIHSTTNALGTGPTHVRFSPDSSLVATCGRDGTVAVWSVSDARLVTRIKAHPDIVLGVGISEDNRLLVTSGRDARVCVWSLVDGRLVSEQRGTHTLSRSAEFLPGANQFLTTGDDRTVRLWATRPTVENLVHTNLPPDAFVVTVLPDGKHFAWARFDGHGGMVELATGRELLDWNDAFPSIFGTAMSARDGRLAAIRAAADGRLQIVMPTEKLKRDWTPPGWAATAGGPGLSVEVSRDLKRFAVADPVNGIGVWTLPDLQLVGRLAVPPITSTALAPDRPVIAFVGRASRPRIHDFESGRDTEMQADVGLTQSCSFSNDGRLFMTAALDGVVNVFEAATGRPVQRLVSRTTGLIVVAATPDSTRVAAGSVDGYISLWDLHTGRELAMFAAHSKPVSSLEFLSDGRLASAAADAVRFWPGR